MLPRLQYSKQGVALTQRFEQFRDKAYWDSLGKVWTIAWGHTRAVFEGMTCTKEEGLEWLQDDYKFCEDLVNDYVSVPINQHQFDALVDFCFNLGCNALKTSTLLRLLNKSDFADAAKEFEKWDHAGGKIVSGLLTRRIAEETEFQEQ